MISPHRSRKYLAFVRGQACAFCPRGASEAHHAFRRAGGGGVGLKGCDLFTVPLCGEHHRELHKTGAVKPYTVTEMPVMLWETIAKSLRAYHLSQEGM